MLLTLPDSNDAIVYLILLTCKQNKGVDDQIITQKQLSLTLCSQEQCYIWYIEIMHKHIHWINTIYILEYSHLLHYCRHSSFFPYCICHFSYLEWGMQGQPRQDLVQVARCNWTHIFLVQSALNEDLDIFRQLDQVMLAFQTEKFQICYQAAEIMRTKCIIMCNGSGHAKLVHNIYIYTKS